MIEKTPLPLQDRLTQLKHEFLLMRKAVELRHKIREILGFGESYELDEIREPELGTKKERVGKDRKAFKIRESSLQNEDSDPHSRPE